ncbi:hypothetical protein [uncultured Alistipes sp.]|uniref:hypothetical protein n=1 Tax=uncultured Alistipes sp. TaxID=538949 RepID=UPI00262DB4D2|nr:hypothetical protein [uncultured Alistipes sp.]
MNGNSMVEQVNRLVGNLLAANSVVWLPDVGTLRVERQAARRLSRREVQPPVRLVNFSSQRSGESLVDAIARAARCDQATAEDIYARWLSRVRTENGVVMEGVGELKFKNFTPDEAFDRRLNPQGRRPMRVHTPRRLDWSVWVGLVAAVLAVGGLVYQFGLERNPLDEPEAEFVEVSEPAAGEALAAGSAVEDAAAEAGGVVAAGNDAAAATGNAAGTNAAVAPADAAAKGAPTGAPAPRSAEAANPSASAPATSAPSAAAQPSAQLAAAPKPAAPAGEPLRMTSKRHYVVLGVYSTLENAERAAALAAKKEPAMRCTVYRFGGKFMVSPFESDDVEASRQFMRAGRSAFPEMWVYSAK